MTKPRSLKLLQKTLLAAAGLLAAAPAAQAYNLGDWSTENGAYSWNYNFTGSLNSNYTLTFTQARARAGVFQINGASSSWGGNDWMETFMGIPIGLRDSYMAQSYVANGTGTIDAIAYDSSSGSRTFLSGSILMPTSTTSLSFNYRFDQTDGGASFSGSFGFSERASQIAYTKAGWNGAGVAGAFAVDSSLSLSAADYANLGYAALNVLPQARNNGITAYLGGSYVRNGNLTVSAGEGLYAKDGGWLDIRGDLLAFGGLLIRHAEITSNRFYGSGDLGAQFESGILSVRNSFAQDMYVSGGRTLGLRDGAVNSSNVYVQGSGYSSGAGMFGSLRSIAGANIQNGFVGINWLGGNGYTVISADAGSAFIINGAVNGVNSFGGANLSYNVGAGAQIVQNGNIGGFVADVKKDSHGDLRLTAANTFTGDLYVNGGTVTAAHSQALAAGGTTYVTSGATLILDGSSSALSVVEDLAILGFGTSGVNGALRNLAGSNTLTGQLALQHNSLVTTAAGSSLTVDGNLVTWGANLYSLDIYTESSGATLSSLNVAGNSGNVSAINKYGAGTASVGTAAEDLLLANVVGGKLTLGGSLSSGANRFGTFNKSGAGALELGGGHYFARYNANAGTTAVAGVLNATNLFGIGTAVVNVNAGGTLSGAVSLVDSAAANVLAGGVLNGDVTLADAATITVSGTSVGTPAVVTNGVINGDITATDDAVITLGSYGVINGDVTIDGNARFVIQANSIHNGDFNAGATSHITIDGRLTNTGAFSSNFLVSGSTRLDGHGLIEGDVLQTGGVVAPGNSPGILTVGSYTNNGGVLDIEIANNTDVAGVGFDQLRTDGAIVVSNANPANYSTIQFTDYALGAAPAYDGVRGDVFQVIATSTGASRNTFDKFDLANYVSASGDRMLFDHSTGRVYGTGLTLGTGTFRDYGVTANQREIGRALWMESVAYDKHVAFTDENFASTALDPVAAAAQRGYKAWILTSHDGVLGEQSTDLGLGAVSVLTAGSAPLALDALSPESFVGLADLGARVVRSYARLGFNSSTLGTAAGWDIGVGYLNDELRSDSSSAFTSYKTASDQVSVTASRNLGERVRVKLGVGYDDGRVSAADFRADVHTIGLGAGLTFTPESKNWQFDLGAGVTMADWESVRGQSRAQADDQQGLSFAGRFTLAPLSMGDFSFTPYAGVAYARSRIDGFAETDVPGSIQLAVDSFSRQSLQSELGASLDYRIKPSTTLSAIFAWEHEFRDEGSTTVNAQFVEAGVTDTDFRVRADGFGVNLFRTGLSIRHEFTPQSSVRLGYNVILGSAVSAGRQIRADYSVRF